MGSIYITPGPFSFFRREVFEKIGPYKHAHNTEDLEIALRMQKNNLKIVNAHDAYVYTIAPKTIRALFKQRVRWIHGFMENAKDYSSLFFRLKRGHLSVFILPMAVFSIFASLYLIGFGVWNSIMLVENKVSQISAIGFGLHKLPQFDWFFVKSESIFILSVILILLTTSLIMAGKYTLGRRISFSADVLYFLLFYGFLAPLWLARSVYNTAFSKKTSWR